MCAVAFDLLVGRDGTEDDFGELAALEGSVGYSTVGYLSTYIYVSSYYSVEEQLETSPDLPNYFQTALYNRYRQMRSVVN